MKQLSLILSLLFAFVAGNGILKAASPTSAADTLNYYVINGKPVEKFDGTQLEGKKIVSYEVTNIVTSTQGPVRVHEIRTEGAPVPESSPRIRIRATTDQTEPVYVVDGKQITKKQFKKLSPASIKSITVVRNGSVKEVQQYPGWENGVILVETKDKDEARKKDTRVNIGYGEADSRELSYSVSSVKQEANVYYTDMYEYLRGKVAGVQFGPDNSIIIRGKNSINSSTQPLILLDGVEISDLNLVNPNDVYSVDVLKDASSAIYGVKGANGVILITTKKGPHLEKQGKAESQEK